MSTATVGQGITPAQEVVTGTVLSVEDEIAPVSVLEQLPPELAAFREQLHEEMRAYVADAERRLAQAREIEYTNLHGGRRTVHAEDLNLGKHLIDGYNLVANSPANGSIAWSNLHVVLLGVDYTIADGNTALKYAYFIKPGSGTTATLQTSATMPVLGPNDALIFINNVSGGMSTPVSVLESSVAYAIGAGAVGSAQLDSATQTLLSNLQQADITLQNQLDGTITSYYQATAPWPDGSPSPAGGNVNQGDIWYDSDNGWTYRWTGTGGTPANTWFRIADTDIGVLQGKINTKVTTYVVTPVAPTGGFTIGDLWLDSANNNLLKRWDGSAWQPYQLGDAAISGIGGAKVGTGINGSNVTAGTVVAARVGAGVANVSLAGATGSLTPARLNTAFHMLY